MIYIKFICNYESGAVGTIVQYTKLKREGDTFTAKKKEKKIYKKKKKENKTSRVENCENIRWKEKYRNSFKIVQMILSKVNCVNILGCSFQKHSHKTN